MDDKRNIASAIRRSIRQTYSQILEAKIILQFKELSFLGWWNATKGIDKKEFERIQIMSNILDGHSNGKTGNQIASEDSTAIADSIEISHKFQEALGLSATNETDYIDFCSQRLGNTASERLLSGQRIRKIADGTYIYVAKFHFWLSIKSMVSFYTSVFIPAWERNNRVGKDRQSLYRTNLEEIDTTLEKMKDNTVNSIHHKQISDYQDLIHETIDIEKVSHNANTDEEKIVVLPRILKVANSYDEKYIMSAISHLNFLFVLLNTPLIPMQLRKNIVATIQKSVLRKVIQNRYDKFRAEYAEAINWRFYLPNHVSPNIVLQDDFDTLGQVSRYGLCLSLRRDIIIKYFFELKKKGYINSDTDIVDFAFALTGKPKKQERHYRQVDWTGAKKQSLAIFLGLLKPVETGWYWRRTPELFLYKGTPLTASQLSTPYGKFAKLPETRQKEWDDIAKIIKMSITK